MPTFPTSPEVNPGNSFHVAASDGERCARATLDFIARHGRA